MMISCKRAAELSCTGLDRRLTLRERFLHRLHIRMCRGCYGFHAQTRKLDAMFRAHFSGVEPQDLEAATDWLSADACMRLEQRLQQEGRSGGS